MSATFLFGCKAVVSVRVSVRICGSLSQVGEQIADVIIQAL